MDIAHEISNSICTYHHIAMRTTKQIKMVTKSSFHELEAVFNCRDTHTDEMFAEAKQEELLI